MYYRKHWAEALLIKGHRRTSAPAGMGEGAKYGRIPNQTAPESKRNFLDSHSYFDWIFDRDVTLNGSIKKR
jgi:hypothetical protein